VEHFNAFTPENEMKWSSIQPAEGQFRFDAADALVEFARKHEMQVTGHTLLWHRQTPDWVHRDDAGEPVSRRLVLQRMRDHMTAVMTRYRGQVRGWDVVNEALRDGRDGYLRDSPWRATLGDDYVAIAFQAAHAIDPHVELYYNDYNLHEPAKRAKAVRLIRDLQQRGVRIDGIGMQSHHWLSVANPGHVAESIAAFAELGLSVHISELDLSVHSGRLPEVDPYAGDLPGAILDRQAETYRSLFEVYFEHREVIERVTFWGLHDGASWLNHYPVRGRPDYPLLFDRSLQPKPAFDAVIGVPNDTR